MAEGLSWSYNNNYTTHLWRSDCRAEIQRHSRAARCFLRIYIPLRAEKSSPMQPSSVYGQ